MSTTRAQADIDRNIAIHDQIARKYDARHGEIFNDIEQARLRDALGRALSIAKDSSLPLTGLDVGCGSGNLTRHMLDLGLQVLAADVSQGFLDLVDHRFKGRPVQTTKLDGRGLSNIPSNSRAVVATYSVLHHVPDYLGAVDEMARVCAPGGVIFIDHEPTDEFWAGDPIYARFQLEALRFDWKKYLVFSNYISKLRQFRDPKYSNEGDIHVWPDDHIEWNKIDQRLDAAGFECMYSNDYLLFRKLYRTEIYSKYLGQCTDMRTRVYRKK